MNIRDQFAEYLADYQPDTSLEVDEQPVTEYLRATMLAGIRDIEPQASLAAHATIRLTGARFDSGVFDSEAAKIFTHLDKEIRAAVPPAAAESIRLGFRAVGTGSVVLALEPFEPAASDGDALFDPIAPSPAEDAFRRVISLHRSLEESASGFAETYPVRLLQRVRMLIDALDDVDGGVEMSLSDSEGYRVKAHLTERGRLNARRVFERTPLVELRTLTGYLNAISIKDEFANVELKHGKTKHEIGQVPAQIAKGLSWDTLINVRVRTVTITDRVAKEMRHEFVDMGDPASPVAFGLSG